MRNGTQGAARPAPRRRPWVRLLLLALSVLLAAYLLLRLIAPGLVDPARLVRFFRYMGMRDKPSYGHISYDGGAGNVYAGFDGGLLVGTEKGLTLYAMDGEQRALIQGSLPTPILRTGGDVSLCFSPGSSYAAAVGSGGEVLFDEAFSGPFVDASVSFDGYAAYVAAESGYKSVAVVLNPEQKPVYRFFSRTSYLNACAVSESGALLAVASLEEQDSVFRSAITIFRTDEEVTDLRTDSGSTVRVQIGNELVYELRFLDRDCLLAVCQHELIFLRTDGTRLNTLPLEHESLTDWCVSEDGWLIVGLRAGVGGGDRVLTLDAEGDELGELPVTGRVRSVSAAGGCAAVLTETAVETFDRRLHPLDRSEDVQGATRAIARPDGTALLIFAGSTSLFIP